MKVIIAHIALLSFFLITGCSDGRINLPENAEKVVPGISGIIETTEELREAGSKLAGLTLEAPGCRFKTTLPFLGDSSQGGTYAEALVNSWKCSAKPRAGYCGAEITVDNLVVEDGGSDNIIYQHIVPVYDITPFGQGQVRLAVLAEARKHRDNTPALHGFLVKRLAWASGDFISGVDPILIFAVTYQQACASSLPGGKD